MLVCLCDPVNAMHWYSAYNCALLRGRKSALVCSTNWNLSLYYFYKLFKIINLNNVEHIPIGKMIYIIPNRT